MVHKRHPSSNQWKMIMFPFVYEYIGDKNCVPATVPADVQQHSSPQGRHFEQPYWWRNFPTSVLAGPIPWQPEGGARNFLCLRAVLTVIAYEAAEGDGGVFKFPTPKTLEHMQAYSRGFTQKPRECYSKYQYHVRHKVTHKLYTLFWTGITENHTLSGITFSYNGEIGEYSHLPPDQSIPPTSCPSSASPVIAP